MYFRPLLFLISISAIGLKVPLGLGHIGLFSLYVYSFFNNKDEFLVQTLIISSGFGLVDFEDVFGVKSFDVVVPIITLLIFFNISSIIQSHQKLLKILGVFLVFLSGTFLVTTFSEEPLSVQLLGLRHYLGFSFCALPAILYKKQIDFDRIVATFTRYWFCFAALIVIQGTIICQSIFFTRASLDFTYQNISLSNVFMQEGILRVYPPAFGLLVFFFYQKNIVNIGRTKSMLSYIAIIVSLSRSLIVSTIAVIIQQSKFSHKFRYIAAIGIFFGLLYFIENNYNIDLRIEKTLHELDQAQNKDYERMGNARYQQSIGPILAVIERDKQWTGVGFVNIENVQSNWLLSNEFMGEEGVITAIEVSPIEYFVTLGLLGSFMLYIFLFYLYVKCKQSTYFRLLQITLILVIISGLGGFWSFVYSDTWSLLGIIVGLIISSEYNLSNESFAKLPMESNNQVILT